MDKNSIRPEPIHGLDRLFPLDRPRSGGFRTTRIGFLAAAALAAAVFSVLSGCAGGGAVRSGASAEYAPGLTVTLVSWKDGASEYAGHPASGRWLTVDVRVDYDGNAPFAELPSYALRVRWEAPDGTPGESAALWVYDPTPGAGGAAEREILRVKISNRFILAYDLPAGAVPRAFLAGGSVLTLAPPSP